MSPYTKIIGANLLVLLLVAAQLQANGGGGRASFGYVVVQSVVIGIQVFINLILSTVAKHKSQQRAYLLSTLLVLLIGIGACALGVQRGV